MQLCTNFCVSSEEGDRRKRTSDQARSRDLHSFAELQPQEPSVPATNPSSPPPIALCTGHRCAAIQRLLEDEAGTASCDGSCGWSSAQECRFRFKHGRWSFFSCRLPLSTCFHESYLLCHAVTHYVNNSLPACSLTYFNINLIRVRSRRGDTRPAHIHPHHILPINREAGHSCGVLEGRTDLNQIAVWVIYSANVSRRTAVWSLPVVDAEETDVGVAVVVIHDVPGEGDVGAVLSGLQVANDFLGTCKCGMVILKCNRYSLTCYA